MRVLGLLLLALVGLSACQVDPYCLDCKSNGGDGGNGDGGNGDGGNGNSGDGGLFDAGRPDACVNTGVEVCDGLDNDCNGVADDQPTDIGGVCQEDLPLPCTPGVFVCTDGKKVCGGGAVPATAELCDGIDNDCDTMVDDGNPGGGLQCGLNMGDCQAGILQCVDDGAGGKTIDCVGDIQPTQEVCDNHDNDCDGMIDDGNPGGGGTCGQGPGVCSPGQFQCLGGAIQCVGASTGTIEKCDGFDNDCDGSVDEDFNLMTDRNNCGACGNVCAQDNAIMGCQAGNCVILACTTGHVNDPTTAGNDCDYACNFQGAEVCDGVDNDCDKQTDEGIVAPAGLCLKLGACSTSTATCQGAAGFKCNYGSTVSKDANGNIIPETKCDNIDNDCDGDVDEPFPLKGTACNDSGVGVCQGKGVQACNAAGNALQCNITTPGGTSSAEICDGKDNNCNGTVDDNASDNWVPITVSGQNRWIYKWEASRPDATASSAGTLANRSCSNNNRIPWTNVTYPQAETACAAAGGRLCTEDEWQAACRSTTTTCVWGMNSCTTYGANTCNGNDLDGDTGTAGDQDVLKGTGSLANCFTDWGSTANRVFDMSGNAKEWAVGPASDPADTRRLRGGSYNNTQGGMKCNFRFAVADNTFQFPNVGFSCCRSTAP